MEGDEEDEEVDEDKANRKKIKKGENNAISSLNVAPDRIEDVLRLNPKLLKNISKSGWC